MRLDVNCARVSQREKKRKGGQTHSKSRHPWTSNCASCSAPRPLFRLPTALNVPHLFVPWRRRSRGWPAWAYKHTARPPTIRFPHRFFCEQLTPQLTRHGKRQSRAGRSSKERHSRRRRLGGAVRRSPFGAAGRARCRRRGRRGGWRTRENWNGERELRLCVCVCDLVKRACACASTIGVRLNAPQGDADGRRCRRRLTLANTNTPPQKNPTQAAAVWPRRARRYVVSWHD
jgi:hypothetical protein